MICIVGVGKMGKALATGFLASGIPASELVLVDHRPERHDELRTQFADVEVSSVPVACDAAVIATKPADVTKAAQQCAAAGAKRIVSIAAGIGLQSIAAMTNEVPVARAMPNVGVLVGASTTGICATDTATAEWAGNLLCRVGTVVHADESDFDAVTALGGSGPAFVARLAEGLIEAGVRHGLSVDAATELVVGMVRSAGATMVASHLDPTQLRKMVSTPNGTTVAGLRALDEGGLGELANAAVDAAAARSKELSQ